MFVQTCVSSHVVRRVGIASGAVTTLAGSAYAQGYINGVGSNARFSQPLGLALYAAGAKAFIADYTNYAIRSMVISTATVDTFAGSPTGISGITDGVGTNILFGTPYGIATDAAGTILLVVENSNYMVRMVNIATRVSSVLAGGDRGTAGIADGIGTSAQLRDPVMVAISGDASYALVVSF